MTLSIELDPEEDGRWIATVPEIPGVSRYGQTREEAVHAVKVLALQVVADMLEHGELTGDLDGVQFAKAA
jgi:predicted RNase H-like HicB family nuclease